MKRTDVTLLLALALGAASHASASPGSPSAPGDTPFAEAPWLLERKILGRNNLESVDNIGSGLDYQVSRAVARVERPDGFGYCTASRVGRGLFLTNFHCDMGCNTMVFRMGYERQVPLRDRTAYRCAKLVRKNENLDYALFAVLAPPPASLEYPVLPLARTPAFPGMKALVASHPSGRTKEIDRSDECVISDAVVFRTESGRDTIKHMCDTEGGSSGAPVIDRERGRAVGLHWGGKSGQFNYAIPMYRIIADLERSLEHETFLDLEIAD